MPEQDSADFNNKSKQGLKRIIQNNLFIIRYIMKYTPFFFLYTVFLAAFAEVVVFFEHTYCIKYLTDTIQYNRPFSDVLSYISVISIVVALKIYILNWHDQSIQLKALEKLHRYIRLDLFDKAINLDLSCYDNPDYYNNFVWSINEASKRIDQTIDYIKQLSSYFAIILTTGTLVVLLDKTGLIFVMVSFLLTLTVSIAMNKIQFKMETELIPKQRKRSYISRVFYLTDYAKEIRLNKITYRLKKDFEDTNKDIHDTIDKYSKKQVLLGFLVDYVFNSFILDGLYIIYLLFITIVKEAISYGSVIALFNSSWRIRSSLLRLAGLIPQFQQNSLYIEKIRTFMEQRSEVIDAENAKETPKQLCLLELKNISFSYKGNENRVINNISLKIKPNEKIAFVGYNGAGKTTITKLLMRLYDVSEGEILFNNVNIKEYKLDSYRSNIGTVFQDHQIFAASIAENVIMDSVINKDKDNVFNALDSSGFTDKLTSFKDGINTQLTREFEDNGVNISGGEAQKIAIARAFAKPCQIVILDEPSSALDPVSEYNLNQAMFEAAKNKTVIFISHRLSTTRMADKIYMLENGCLIEEGNHEELMSLNGKYAEMFNLQAEKYKFVV